MQRSDALRVGICGVGGFALVASKYLRRCGGTATPPLLLSAACDPAIRQYVEQVRELREQGVMVGDQFDQMLQRDDIAGVWLPLPIDLHREYTERALAAGKYVLCEKPAAGCIEDVDAMIAARDASGLGVIVGFQDVYDPTTTQLKRMILDGRIGRVTHATLRACRPRGARYFSRNDWSGRIERLGRWLLDSPANNAMAHFVNLVLLLLGPTFDSSAAPVAVSAELYRAAEIENYDTISARVTLAGGADFLVLLTHACSHDTEAVFKIYGEEGVIECDSLVYRVVSRSGEQVIRRTNRDDVYVHMMDAWARMITGREAAGSLVATLENARQHTLLVCGASEAAAITTVGPEATVPIKDKRGDPVVAIQEIEDVFEYCADRNLMLHESGRLPFTRPAGHFDLRDYRRFSGGPERVTTVASDRQGVC